MLKMKGEMGRIEFRVFAVILVLLLCFLEILLAHNVLYTEGEVMQALYKISLFANIPIMAFALTKPRIGIWCAVALGALLLPWQISQNRKWAIIHEEVFAIIQYVETAEKEDGVYPATLESYDFKTEWVRDHVAYGSSNGSYRLAYYMNDFTISYWYDPEDGGFGYYPD